jgi:poly-beta-hydroxyalkanoate depolymerase
VHYGRVQSCWNGRPRFPLLPNDRKTVKLVFHDDVLPLGMLKVHGRPVNPGAIKRTALLTVEGERDDICGLGQTLAAQELCMGLRQHMKAAFFGTARR